MNQPANADDYILTPHGLQHRLDVRLIEGDHQVIEPRMFPPVGLGALRSLSPGGWIESAIFTPPEPLQSMSVKFQVPDPPTKPGALIYLFPAAESAYLNTILQPVLQYGYNKLFGGNCWTLACWHCTPEGVTLYSKPIDVAPGETIFATIQVMEDGFHDDSCDWSIEAKVFSHPDGLPESEIVERCTTLHVYGLKLLLLFLVAGALEAYSLDQPGSRPDWSQYPESGSTTFSEIQLTSLTGNPFRADWNKRLLLGVCGLDVSVSTDRSSVTLDYP